MKMKKLLSTFAAMAIAASSFAGLGISANAFSVGYSENFESTTEMSFTKVGRGTGSIYNASEDTTTNTSKMLKFTTANNTQNGDGDYIIKNINGQISKAEFDFNIASNYMSVALGNYRSYTSNITSYKKTNNMSMHTTGVVFSAGTTRQSSADYYSVNNIKANDFTQNSWYHAVVEMDYTNKKIDYKIYPYSADGNYETATETKSGTSVNFLDNTVGTVDSILLQSSNDSASAYLDNIKFTVYDQPALTLSTDEVEISSTTTTATVDVSDITGDITVKSSADSVATAVYDADTNKITVTYVADGAATITVTATKDGLTTEKEIKVISGTVQPETITVNYYVTDTTDTVPGKTAALEEKYTNDTITADELNVTTVKDSSARYTFNAEKSTALPYTVVDGENIINLYFDKDVNVASYTVNYTGITKASDTITLTDTYVNDTYSYTPNKYVKDVDGKWWTTDLKAYTGKLTTDTKVDIAYTADTAENIVAYYEVEDLANSAAVSDASYSGGKYAHINGAKTAEIGTLPAGKYTLEINLKERGDRGAFLRNASDVTEIITSVDLNKNSVAGVYTKEFSITTPTTVAFAGCTNTRNAINQSAEIDYVLIRKTGDVPALTVATSAPSGITAPTTTTAFEITSGTKAETATNVDLTDVQTVYIKVENIDDTSVMPAVVVGDKTYAPTYKYTANNNGYFIYQFVGIDLTDAKVTYTGAADKTVSSEA